MRRFVVFLIVAAAAVVLLGGSKPGVKTRARVPYDGVRPTITATSTQTFQHTLTAHVPEADTTISSAGPAAFTATLEFAPRLLTDGGDTVFYVLRAVTLGGDIDTFPLFNSGVVVASGGELDRVIYSFAFAGWDSAGTADAIRAYLSVEASVPCTYSAQFSSVGFADAAGQPDVPFTHEGLAVTDTLDTGIPTYTGYLFAILTAYEIDVGPMPDLAYAYTVVDVADPGDSDPPDLVLFYVLPTDSTGARDYIKLYAEGVVWDRPDTTSPVYVDYQWGFKSVYPFNAYQWTPLDWDDAAITRFPVIGDGFFFISINTNIETEWMTTGVDSLAIRLRAGDFHDNWTDWDIYRVLYVRQEAPEPPPPDAVYAFTDAGYSTETDTFRVYAEFEADSAVQVVLNYAMRCSGEIGELNEPADSTVPVTLFGALWDTEYSLYQASLCDSVIFFAEVAGDTVARAAVEIDFFAPPPLYPAPTDFAAVATYGCFNLTWDDTGIIGNDGYYVYLAIEDELDPGNPGMFLPFGYVEAPATEALFCVPGTEGDQYWLYITAVWDVYEPGEVESDPSDTDTDTYIELTPATNLVVTPGHDDGTFSLSWDAPVEWTPDNYYAWYAEADELEPLEPGEFFFLGTSETTELFAPAPNYEDFWEFGVLYWFTVTSERGFPDGISSAGTDTVQSNLEVPMPTSVTVAPHYEAAVVSWSHVGADSFRVLAGDAADNLEVVAYEVETEYYDVTGLTNEDTYFFAVQAMRGTVASDTTAAVEAYINIQPPAGLSATPSDGKITLNWTAGMGVPADVDSFRVYRAATVSEDHALIEDRVNYGDLPLDDEDVSNDTEYFYYVTSVKGHDPVVAVSAPSDTVSAEPTGASATRTIAFVYSRNCTAFRISAEADSLTVYNANLSGEIQWDDELFAAAFDTVINRSNSAAAGNTGNIAWHARLNEGATGEAITTSDVVSMSAHNGLPFADGGSDIAGLFAWTNLSGDMSGRTIIGGRFIGFIPIGSSGVMASGTTCYMTAVNTALPYQWLTNGTSNLFACNLDYANHSDTTAWSASMLDNANYDTLAEFGSSVSFDGADYTNGGRFYVFDVSSAVTAWNSGSKGILMISGTADTADAFRFFHNNYAGANMRPILVLIVEEEIE